MTIEPGHARSMRSEHEALGGTILTVGGVFVAADYGDVGREVLAVRRSAGVFDLSHTSAFRLFGFRAEGSLRAALAIGATLPTEVGTLTRALMLGEQGEVVDRVTVCRSGDLEFMLLGSAGARGRVRNVLGGLAPEEVEFVDETERAGHLALCGPKAAGVLRELCANLTIPDVGILVPAVLDTVPCLVLHSDLGGEDGVELLCAADHTSGLWRALLSFAEVTPCGMKSAEVLRVESGVPPFGRLADLSGSNGVEQGVLAGFTWRGAPPKVGAALLRDGQAVGMVADAVLSPSLGTGIGLAYVAKSTGGFADGIALEVADAGTTIELAPLPFVRGGSRARPR